MQGKWGIRTQNSFTHSFPFCSLPLFCRALTGGIQNGPIPVVPRQVDTTNWNPGKVITLTPSATTRMDFPWGKTRKGQKTTASLPLYPGVLLSKGAHSCQASCSSCRWVMAGFGAPSSPGMGRESEFHPALLWIGSWVREETRHLTVQPMMLRVDLGFGSWGTKRKMWKCWLIGGASEVSSYWRGGCQNCCPGFKHLILQCESQSVSSFFFFYFNYRNSQNYYIQVK